MKYTSVNAISDFEFHDVELELNYWVDTSLSLKAKHLSIHKNTPQNPYESDMEIAEALISFDGIDVHSYKVGGTQVYDDKHNLIQSTPDVIFHGNEAYEKLRDSLEDNGATVFDFGTRDGQEYYMDAHRNSLFYTIFFTFDKVTVEWEEYKGSAWYVE